MASALDMYLKKHKKSDPYAGKGEKKGKMKGGAGVGKKVKTSKKEAFPKDAADSEFETVSKEGKMKSKKRPYLAD
jgi:hypothetical protein